MSFDTDLYTYLADLVSPVPVEEGKVSEEQPATRVCFIRSEPEIDVFLNGQPALYKTEYDLEAQAEDLATAQSLAATVQTALNGFYGLIGSSRVLGCFAVGQAGDYQPKLLNADEGHFVASLRLTFYS